MNRRNSLKVMAIGSLSAGTLFSACNYKEATKEKDAQPAEPYGRTSAEIAHDAKLHEEKFFTAHETATLSILCDMVIPADSRSGSATDAGVPDFIEFIVKDQPVLQDPIRGGLKWLDMKSLKLFKKVFKSAVPRQQFKMLEQIAYPENAAKEDAPGVSFFNTIRNLTATGFFTSKTGLEDLGYQGNTPNAWNGVPQEVLEQYDLEYDEKTVAQCLKDEDRGKMMVWE